MEYEMTMPHLMNCPHMSDGWCLDCVNKQWEEMQELRKNAVPSVQPAATDADFRETVGLMLSAVGYTDEYARQWPKEKASVTFKRWFDEQIENAKSAQPVQPADK